MKNLIKISLIITLLLVGTHVNAQFTNATIAETNQPLAPGFADNSNSVNCYTYGGVTMDSSSTQWDLSIHVWCSPKLTGGAGLAWSQIIPTVDTYKNELTLLDSMLSADVVLTKTLDDSVFALVVYQNPVDGRLYQKSDTASFLYYIKYNLL